MSVKGRRSLRLPVSEFSSQGQIFLDPALGSDVDSGRKYSFYRVRVKRWMDLVIVVLAGPIIVVVVA